MRIKATAIAFVIALVAALTLVVGCSSSAGSSSAASSAASTSAASAAASASAASSASAAAPSASAAAKATTLEDYFTAHPREWQSILDSLTEQGGDFLDVELVLEGNKISQIMTYKDTFNEEQLKQVKASFEEQGDSFKANIADSIRQIESAAGIEGITWLFEYRNGDGALIWGAEVSGK